MLAAGKLDDARAACDELETVAARYSSALLDAITAYEHGAVELASGHAPRALELLRRALDAWRTLEAPYEVARTRLLIGEACRALDDTDACELELEAALAGVLPSIRSTTDRGGVRDGVDRTHRCPDHRSGPVGARARIPAAEARPAGSARRPKRPHRRQLAQPVGFAEALLAGESRR